MTIKLPVRIHHPSFSVAIQSICRLPGATIFHVLPKLIIFGLQFFHSSKGAQSKGKTSEANLHQQSQGFGLQSVCFRSFNEGALLQAFLFVESE
jgi:hypothetical protein